MPATQTRNEPIEHPHVGWWVSVLGGMGFLAVLAFNSGAYTLWCGLVTTALPQGLLRGIFIIAVLLHLGEGTYALRVAQRAGLGAQAVAWSVQTMLLGFPSLRLLLRRVKGAP